MRDPLDPGQLSDALDRHLPPGSDHVLPDQPDDPAVMAASRLASSPKPALDPAARARMKAQVMAAVPRSAPGGPRPILRIAVFALVSAAVMAAALLGLFAALNIGPTNASPTPAGVAVVVETGTPSDTPASTPPTPVTSTPPPAPSDTPTSTPPTPSATPTPVTSTSPPAPSDTPASTAERAARITLEGVVEAIDDRRLTISGLEVELVEDDPLLDVLRVNDRVRIEGKLVRGARMFNIRVETFVLANDDAAENLVETGPDGDLWRDPGGCDNPPPPWAKAYGWRARCEGGGTSGGGQGSSDRPNSSRDSRASDAQDDDD
ncbi:MAG: hypothetical protein IT298_16220 [Chloroflexi bacterium]|nr:hypothetical protein [Chloroflexota bacterium]